MSSENNEPLNGDDTTTVEIIAERIALLLQRLDDVRSSKDNANGNTTDGGLSSIEKRKLDAIYSELAEVARAAQTELGMPALTANDLLSATSSMEQSYNHVGTKPKRKFDQLTTNDDDEEGIKDTTTTTADDGEASDQPSLPQSQLERIAKKKRATTLLDFFRIIPRSDSHHLPKAQVQDIFSGPYDTRVILGAKDILDHILSFVEDVKSRRALINTNKAVRETHKEREETIIRGWEQALLQGGDNNLDNVANSFCNRIQDVMLVISEQSDRDVVSSMVENNINPRVTELDVDSNVPSSDYGRRYISKQLRVRQIFEHIVRALLERDRSITSRTLLRVFLSGLRARHNKTPSSLPGVQDHFRIEGLNEDYFDTF